MIEEAIGDILDTTAEKFPDKDALVYVNRNLRDSYADFRDICNKVAKNFRMVRCHVGNV